MRAAQVVACARAGGVSSLCLRVRVDPASCNRSRIQTDADPCQRRDLLRRQVCLQGRQPPGRMAARVAAGVDWEVRGLGVLGVVQHPGRRRTGKPDRSNRLSFDPSSARLYSARRCVLGEDLAQSSSSRMCRRLPRSCSIREALRLRIDIRLEAGVEIPVLLLCRERVQPDALNRCLGPHWHPAAVFSNRGSDAARPTQDGDTECGGRCSALRSGWSA